MTVIIDRVKSVSKFLPKHVMWIYIHNSSKLIHHSKSSQGKHPFHVCHLKSKQKNGKYQKTMLDPYIGLWNLSSLDQILLDLIK